jgi:lysine/ornithine N-monooxygenase
MKIISAFEKEKREQIINDLRTFFSGCSCANMVTFYGCYYEQGRINQIIEFMNLGSLRSVINLVNNNKIRIPETVLACIAAQV